MSGYLTAHGHTMTVDLVVSNDRELHGQLQEILDTFDPFGVFPVDERRRVGAIENAAAAYRRLVRTISSTQHSDMRGVDLDKVDFHALIRHELNERGIFTVK